MIDLKSTVFHENPGHSIAIGWEEIVVQARERTVNDRLAPFLGHDGAGIPTTTGVEGGIVTLMEVLSIRMNYRKSKKCRRAWNS